MRRTQFYLGEDLDDALRAAAEAEDRSAAAIVRDAVQEYLTRRKQPTQEDPILALIGAFEGGPTDAAEEHDTYLYSDEEA